ncbi:MAG: Type IV pilus assembly protein PilB [Candidatus Woesebacteria bacterium GW2011_GWA1_45_8]|uniref:Type IV pilus assembly protein PilB n=1 Tax=Candidatus Woesebacteria bacterium GW2011_GWA1_45_8 TaxID=1618559 RepID=A0A0G1Q3T0_9BACT|nr:MAG: Type IV pilus assembly protein PilB [Candidatus Woesebacteria bacterium GW2011_GWA1_45_8]
MKLPNEKLKEILVGSNFIAEKDFDEAAASASDVGKTTDDILIFRGLISEEALAKLVSEHTKVPYVNIGRQIIPEDVLALIPEKMARTYRMVPFAKEGTKLLLAMENPDDFEALEFAKRHSRLKIIPHYTSSADIRRSLGQYKRNIRLDFDKIIAENVKKAAPGVNPIKAAEELPIIKVLDTIFMYAVAERASDIHIETQEDEVVVRLRIDGVLRDILKLPRGIEDALVARIKILSNLKIDEHRIPQDGRHKFNIDEEVIALRISIIPGFYGENVVMRLLPESTRPQSLEELGLTGSNFEIIAKNIKKPHGMILVTGPTGSGKTTTLYSVLNILNTIKVKICTIEDPIEYGLKRLTQIQVNPKAGMDFAAGLRALLRHDPNIIMVGEIRDKETAQIAVHSALTGHLVLSTLHTNDAPGAIPRLLDMGVEGYLVASTVNVIVAQRLVRKICSSCITEYTPEKEVLNMVSKVLGADVKTQKFYKGAGCSECHMGGYAGRVGLYEVLEVTEKIRQLTSDKSSADLMQKTAIDEGMITMAQDGINKVAAGLTTIDEVLRVVKED